MEIRSDISDKNNICDGSNNFTIIRATTMYLKVRGVMAPCYQHHYKVSQLEATQSELSGYQQRCSYSLQMPVQVSMIKGNKTEFQFIYHLKGQCQPSMMILLPQFLNRCKKSYRGESFTKGDKKGMSQCCLLTSENER